MSWPITSARWLAGEYQGSCVLNRHPHRVTWNREDDSGGTSGQVEAARPPHSIRCFLHISRAPDLAVPLGGTGNRIQTSLLPSPGHPQPLPGRVMTSFSTESSAPGSSRSSLPSCGRLLSRCSTWYYVRHSRLRCVEFRIASGTRRTTWCV